MAQFASRANVNGFAETHLQAICFGEQASIEDDEAMILLVGWNHMKFSGGLHWLHFMPHFTANNLPINGIYGLNNFCLFEGVSFVRSITLDNSSLL